MVNLAPLFGIFAGCALLMSHFIAWAIGYKAGARYATEYIFSRGEPIE